MVDKTNAAQMHQRVNFSHRHASDLELVNVHHSQEARKALGHDEVNGVPGDSLHSHFTLAFEA